MRELAGALALIIFVGVALASCSTNEQWSDEKCAATRLSALSGNDEAAFDLQDHCEG